MNRILYSSHRCRQTTILIIIIILLFSAIYYLINNNHDDDIDKEIESIRTGRYILRNIYRYKIQFIIHKNAHLYYTVSSSVSIIYYFIYSSQIVSLLCIQMISSRLFDKYSVLCFVILRPNAIDRQSAIIDSWGTKCNRLLFVSANSNNQSSLLNTTNHRISELRVNIHDGYDRIWVKVQAAILFIADNYRLSIIVILFKLLIFDQNAYFYLKYVNVNL